MTNHELFGRAKAVMPGGVNSPVRAFNSVGIEPFIVKSANGDKITDVEGNSYVDFVCSFGPNILGHGDERVLKAIHNAVENGLTYGATCENEIKLCEMIKDATPSAEKVRLVNSGTEAVMSAVRLARGYTGKNYIIKFAGCYHGHSDSLLVKGGSGLLTDSLPNSNGVPGEFTKYTLVANYNDKKSVEELYSKFGDDIAAVVVEPVAANMGVVLPNDDFLPFLRKITKDNNSLLIFDEVITGFRLGYNSAQGYFGVTPDITTLGKIIGGGLPVGAYCASDEIMNLVAPVGNVYQAGTLSGNPITVAAGLVTLEILKENPNIYDEIESKAKRIATAFNAAFGDMAHANQIGSLLTFFFTDKSVTSFSDVQKCDTAEFAEFFRFMLSCGFYIPPSQFEAMFVSTKHSDADIDDFISAIEEFANGI